MFGYLKNTTAPTRDKWANAQRSIVFFVHWIFFCPRPFLRGHITSGTQVICCLPHWARGIHIMHSVNQAVIVSDNSLPLVRYQTMFLSHTGSCYFSSIIIYCFVDASEHISMNLNREQLAYKEMDSESSAKRRILHSLNMLIDVIGPSWVDKSVHKLILQDVHYWKLF